LEEETIAYARWAIRVAMADSIFLSDRQYYSRLQNRLHLFAAESSTAPQSYCPSINWQNISGMLQGNRH
jgi:hypothetical protein